jgi:hypothetical protein
VHAAQSLTLKLEKLLLLQMCTQRSRWRWSSRSWIWMLLLLLKHRLFHWVVKCWGGAGAESCVSSAEVAPALKELCCWCHMMSPVSHDVTDVADVADVADVVDVAWCRMKCCRIMSLKCWVAALVAAAARSLLELLLTKPLLPSCCG